MGYTSHIYSIDEESHRETQKLGVARDNNNIDLMLVSIEKLVHVCSFHGRSSMVTIGVEHLQP